MKSQEESKFGIPGGLLVKDLTLSLLWHRFDPWPGTFVWRGHSQKKKKKERKKRKEKAERE